MRLIIKMRSDLSLWNYVYALHFTTSASQVLVSKYIYVYTHVHVYACMYVLNCDVLGQLRCEFRLNIVNVFLVSKI